MVLIVTACGGDDTSSDQTVEPESQTDQEDGSDDGNAGDSGDTDDGTGQQDSDDGTSDNGGGGEPPDLDPSNMPGAGEVVFAVDGETFTITADAMDYFTCDPSEEFVNVQSESEAQSLSIQFDPGLGRGNATVRIEGSDFRYDSSFGPETPGGLAVDSPHILYEGRFDASNLNDLADITDVGTGQISVTCP